MELLGAAVELKRAWQGDCYGYELAKAGLLDSWWEDPAIAEADGRPRRRFYRITGAGAGMVHRPGERIPSALRRRARIGCRHSGTGDGMSARRLLEGVEVVRPLPLGARLTRSWSRTYTYGLPAEVALARRDEIAADLHDQLTDTAGGLLRRGVEGDRHPQAPRRSRRSLLALNRLGPTGAPDEERPP